MKALRVFYVVAIVVSVGLSLAIYWQYQLKDRVLARYQEMSELSNEASIKTSQELAKSRQRIDELNKTIAALTKDNVKLTKDTAKFNTELLALKGEREALQVKIARLIEEQTILEKRFYSLEELKKALRIAKIEHRRSKTAKRMQRRLAKIEMLKALDEIALQQGNRGLLVRGGELTFQPTTKVRVELEPVGEFSHREMK